MPPIPQRSVPNPSALVPLVQAVVWRILTVHEASRKPHCHGETCATIGVGDSATLLYINEGLIRLAKVTVIARGHLTGLLLCGFFFSASMT